MGGLSAPARAIVLARMAVGVSSWVAPKLVARLFAVDPKHNPNLPYVMRLFAVRDLVLALGPLLSRGQARTLWLQMGMLSDAADIAAAGLGARDGSLPVAAAVLGGSAAAGGVALGAAALAAGDDEPA